MDFVELNADQAVETSRSRTGRAPAGLKQAQCVAALVGAYLPHLAFDVEQLRMLPKDVAAEAEPLFQTSARGRS